MTGRRIAIALTLLMLATRPATAGDNGIGLGEIFGFSADEDVKLKVSDREQNSLGCMIAAAGAGMATVLFSSAVIIATRGHGAAAATTVAIPVLAATMTAACALGSQAAPGIVWLRHNSETIFGKVMNTIPAEPLVKVLPGLNDTPAK